jgi:YHS domain-containing protein
MRFESSCSIRQSWLALTAVVVLVAILSNVRGNESEDVSTEDPYPLRNCVILDCPLGDEAEVLYVDGREIRVCCDDCVNQFGDSEHWMAVVDERIVEQQTPHYPLKKCVVDGKPLDDFNTIDKVFGNRLFRLCSDDCYTALRKHPAKYFRLLNEAVIKKQKRNYPSAKCIVSDKPLGKKAIDHVVANQLIRLADRDQLDKFDENPGRYLEKLGKLRPGDKKLR